MIGALFAKVFTPRNESICYWDPDDERLKCFDKTTETRCGDDGHVCDTQNKDVYLKRKDDTLIRKAFPQDKCPTEAFEEACTFNGDEDFEYWGSPSEYGLTESMILLGIGVVIYVFLYLLMYNIAGGYQDFIIKVEEENKQWKRLRQTAPMKQQTIVNVNVEGKETRVIGEKNQTSLRIPFKK